MVLVVSMILVLTVVVALHHHFQLYVFLVVHWVVLVVLEALVVLGERVSSKNRVLIEVVQELKVSMILVLTVVVALYQLYFFLAVHREGLQVVQAVWVWIHRVVREVLVERVSWKNFVLLSTAVTESVASKILVLTVVVALHHHYQLYFFRAMLQVILKVWVWIHQEERAASTIHSGVLVVLVSSMMVELTVVVVQHYQLYFFLVVHHREELEFQVSSTMVEQREVHYLGVHLAVSVVHQVELAVWLLLEDLEDLVALVSWKKEGLVVLVS